MLTRSLAKSLTRRAALAAVFLSGALVATRLDAQPEVDALRSTRFELRPYVGAYIPTGDQRDLLEDAMLLGAQASWRIVPQFALTGSFGWSPSKDRISVGDQKLDVYQYDIGAEARAPLLLATDSWDFTPFVGLGVGGRTYDYRDLDNVDANTNVAG